MLSLNLDFKKKTTFFSTFYALNSKINISCAEIVILELRILPIHSRLFRENFHACLKNINLILKAF